MLFWTCTGLKCLVLPRLRMGHFCVKIYLHKPCSFGILTLVLSRRYEDKTREPKNPLGFLTILFMFITPLDGVFSSLDMYIIDSWKWPRWAVSSSGRALHLQCRGGRSESGTVHTNAYLNWWLTLEIIHLRINHELKWAPKKLFLEKWIDYASRSHEFIWIQIQIEAKILIYSTHAISGCLGSKSRRRTFQVCESCRGGDKNLWSGSVRMGKPSQIYLVVFCNLLQNSGTWGTEISKYPKEKKSNESPLVSDERTGVSPNREFIYGVVGPNTI